MPRLPPLHTTATNTEANAPGATLVILIELWNLQDFCSQLRGTHDVIENLLVNLQCRRSNQRT